MLARGRAVLGLDAGGGAFFPRLGRVRGCGGGRGARWLWMMRGGGEAEVWRREFEVWGRERGGVLWLWLVEEGGMLLRYGQGPERTFGEESG